jgi:hypothetical protein
VTGKRRWTIGCGSGAAFLERLFYPAAKASDETIQMWAEALAEADKIA